METLGTDDTMQPNIGDEEENDEEEDDEGGDKDPMQIEELDDNNKGLLEDELRRIQKGDSVDILSSLHMKLEELF